MFRVPTSVDEALSYFCLQHSLIALNKIFHNLTVALAWGESFMAKVFCYFLINKELHWVSCTYTFQSRPSSREFDDAALINSQLLQEKLNDVSSRLTTMLQTTSSHLSRSVSSVGEHSSNTFTAVPIPKRAETFAGFDNNHEHKRMLYI